MDLIVDACAIALVINWVIALLLWQLRFGSYQSAPGPIFTGWPFCYASSVGLASGMAPLGINHLFAIFTAPGNRSCSQ